MIFKLFKDGLFIGFLVRNVPLVKVIGNPISDVSLSLTFPCLIRIILRGSKKLSSDSVGLQELHLDW